MGRTYHFQRPSDDPTEDITKPQLLLRPPIIRQLHEIRQRILLKHQIEAPPLFVPTLHPGTNIHEDLEPHPCDRFSRLPEIRARPEVRLGEEVLDQPDADVVAHAVELGVDGGVVGFGGGGGEGEVAAELGDDGAVGEGQDFDVDLLRAGSVAPVSGAV